ncbi:DNA helicase, ATP-dependent [Quillaja saponaria]|uniref:DNA 3'-5' helicase n=1 Tax=Quillaja saponaria TaxID=32244 RepID=A0AAD7LGW0_QUISA|nr:DNA helicase, ATP-dependent [Quillaja saponaria]
MESDSDSDGSHISATPPRKVNPPSLPPPPPPPIIFSSNNSRVRNKPSYSSVSKIISKPKKVSSRRPKPPSKSDPKPEPTPSQHDICAEAVTHPTLPFQILRPSDRIRPSSTADSIENLPAGYFSKSVSFSKFRRPLFNLEPSEDGPSLRSVSTPEPKIESGGFCSPDVNSVTSEFKGEAVSVRSSAKLAKKHPNLIGANVPMPPVKLRKCGNEGNFVRLNLNGNRRKFMKKGSKQSGKFSGRRSYRRSKGKLKHEGQTGTNMVYEEDGLVIETIQQKRSGDRGGREYSCELIEGTVLAARYEPSDENLVNLLKLMFGYDSFRDGQLEAIKMVLSGKSTMLVLPTGAGKSLCYQLPAMILPGITLVVSPLVALMIDQLKQLPPMMQGGLICSSQTPEEVSETLKQVQQGTIKVLFVSPERFLNAEFLAIFSDAVISLVVVDEAHCISEWSHNFRPSYMRLRASFLHSRLNVGCILAMTATATTTTLDAVMSALDIPRTSLIQNTQMKDLMMLIKSSPFSDVQSIIIYCKFQYEADQISRYLCDNNIPAKSYHSGMLAKERSRVQELFCSNKIRVVVATVAFGMGLDKRDVGAVIHYSLPESLEEYVQEIGRAGRDGRLSYCHLFYDDDTYFKLRSLMHSDGVDEYAVNKFLHEAFSFESDFHGKTCSLVKESASRKFDMKEEVMLTLLTHLELSDVQYLRLLPQLNVTCTLSFHKTPPLLLAEKVSVVAAILKRSENKQGQYVFDMPTVANSIGIPSINLSNQLQNLKLTGEITYEVKDLAYCYMIVEVPADLLSLSSYLTKWLTEVEGCKVRKLDAMSNAANFAINECDKRHGCSGANHTRCLQRKILDYFSGIDKYDVSNKMPQSSPFLRADIKVFLQSNSQVRFTPRAIARIMHGIASPAYPSATWSNTHFWGRYTKLDFHLLTEAARAELMNFVGKDSL